MSVASFCVVVVIFSSFVTSTHGAVLVRGASCFTPNNQKAICTAVSYCKVIKDAVGSRRAAAIDFAKRSQCGYDTEALVCCGTTGFPVSTVVFDSQSSNVITPFKHRLLPDKNVCGIERSGDRIFGGDYADLDEHPWLALLRYKDEVGDDAGFKCGGSLINKRYVLTAAHCVVLKINTGLNLSGVRLGEWKISTSQDCVGAKGAEECSDAVVDVGVQKSIPHASYDRKNHDNDIALVRLQRNIAFTDFVRPICIPAPNTSPPEAGSQVVVAGWGATENSSSSDIKQKLQVPVVAQAACTAKIAKRGHISENQICAGGVKGKDSCQGDSGGPLMRIVQRNAMSEFQWLQEGVISWGVGCGISGYPGIYTRVAKYSIWIVNNMVDF